MGSDVARARLFVRLDRHEKHAISRGSWLLAAIGPVQYPVKQRRVGVSVGPVTLKKVSTGRLNWQ